MFHSGQYILTHLEKSVALDWNKFESPSLKDALRQVWLNLVVLEKIFRSLHSTSTISLFNMPGLEKGMTLYLQGTITNSNRSPESLG